MSRAWKVAGLIAAVFAAFAWGNYRWHQGFTAGADTILCLHAGQIDGWEEAMRSDACQNIKGRGVPWFPHNLRPQGPPAEIEVQP